MAYGLNSYGFDRPTLADIISDTKDTFTETFVGQNINVAENSVLDKIITIFADRESTLWELQEDIYYSQTLAGAENIYLDDILSKRGVFRNAATAASGNIQVTLSSLASYTDNYSAGNFSILNDTFTNTEDFTVAGNIFAHKITNTNITANTTYTFTILNTTTEATASITASTATTLVGSTALNTFYQKIKDFIVDNTIESNDDLIQIDTVNGILYIGYDTNYNLSGLNTLVDFKTTPVIGQRIIQIEMKANDVGYNPIYAGAVTSISPEPTDYISVTNILDFSTGSDVESDSEYRARADSTSASGAAATRSAIISGLLDVEGVQKVKLYPNPTSSTSVEGVPAYQMMIVVYGGTTADIAQAIYDLVGVNIQTYGTTAYTITTEDSDTQVIYHTKASEKQLSVRVTYTTSNNRALSDTEKDAIISGITTLADEFTISSTVYNFQLTTAVSSSVTSSRFLSLIVETKDKDAPDTAYTVSNVVPAYTELCSISSDDITFVQSI